MPQLLGPATSRFALQAAGYLRGCHTLALAVLLDELV